MPYKAELKISIIMNTTVCMTPNQYEHLAIVCFFPLQSSYYSPCGP